MTEILGGIDPTKCPSTGNDCIYRKIIHQSYLNTLWELERVEEHNSEAFTTQLSSKADTQRELLLGGCLEPAKICGLALAAVVRQAE